MRPLSFLVCVALLFWTDSARSQESFSVTGDVDLRWVHAMGESSYLNGGLGILRFDPQHEDLQFGRAFLASNLRITDTVTVHAAIDAYGDYGGNPADLSQFYIDIRPFPTTSVRWRARVGAFFMPVSLENRGSGWSDVYSITPSAINTWIGEEFRTIGAEVESRWLGASSGYLGDVALVAAAYGWNDPAGLLIAQRGFALSDRTSTLFDGLGKSDDSFYHEIDKKVGYYAGISWRHHDRLEMRVLRYDNRGDPAAYESDRAAWRTRFWSAGARLEPSSHWTFAAQYLDGDTAVGADDPGVAQFLMRFRAEYALASFEWGRQRLTARYDDFHTHQLTGFFGSPSNQDGHGWTFAWSRELGEHWQLLAEWLHVASIFPPRADIGIAPAQTQSQLQLAARYKFQFGW